MPAQIAKPAGTLVMKTTTRRLENCSLDDQILTAEHWAAETDSIYCSRTQS